MAASTSTTTEVPPLGKFLASSDKKTRDKAIQNLTAFFSDPSRDALSSLELAKLWKGIFYCFWMSDKPLVQQALAAELAEIVLTFSDASSSLEFLQGFWESTVREWTGIDRLRMDKFLMLVRRFVNASFRLLHKNNWEPALCEDYNELLTKKGGPLCPEDIRVPAGLTYHITDIYLEELDKASYLPASTPLNIMLLPLINLAAKTPTKNTYQRIQSAVLEPLLAELQPPAASDPPRKRQKLETPQFTDLLSNACLDNPTKQGSQDKSKLRAGLLKLIFDIASNEGTKDANRRRLYAIWKANTEDEDDDEE